MVSPKLRLAEPDLLHSLNSTHSGVLALQGLRLDCVCVCMGVWVRVCVCACGWVRVGGGRQEGEERGRGETRPGVDPEGRIPEMGEHRAKHRGLSFSRGISGPRLPGSRFLSSRRKGTSVFALTSSAPCSTSGQLPKGGFPWAPRRWGKPITHPDKEAAANSSCSAALRKKGPSLTYWPHFRHSPWGAGLIRALAQRRGSFETVTWRAGQSHLPADDVQRWGTGHSSP